MHLRHDPGGLRRVTDPAEFGRVAVLFGGSSTEREISLLTGRAVLAALQRRGVDAHGFDPAERDLGQLRSAGFAPRLDRAARPRRRGRHGAGGARVPRHSLHRQRRHRLGDRHGQAAHQAPGRRRRRADARTSSCCARPPTSQLALERLGLPLIVKPASQGSSVGMTHGRARAELPAAWRAATQLRAGGLRRALDHGRRVHRRRSCRAWRCPRSASRRRASSTTTRPSTSATTPASTCPSGLSTAAERAHAPRSRSRPSRPAAPRAGAASTS